MSSPDRHEGLPLLARLAGAVVLGSGLPLGLALLLNFLRPDLMGPMLERDFGASLVRIEALLCFMGTTLYAVAATIRFKTRWPIVLLVAAGLLLCTGPALLGVLFGPIVFAFTQGPQP